MLFGYGCLRVNEATYDVSYEKRALKGYHQLRMLSGITYGVSIKS